MIFEYKVEKTNKIPNSAYLAFGIICIVASS